MTQNLNRQLQVLHVLRSADVGGIEKLVAQLVKAQLEDSQIEVAVLFVTQGNGELGHLFRDKRLQVTELNLTSGYAASPAKYRRAREKMREFDIVHVHTFNPLVALASARADARVLYTEHGNFGFGRKWTIGDRIKTRLFMLYLRFAIDYVSFNSKFTQSYFATRYGADGVPKSVVYNGIDLEETRAPGHASRETVEKADGKFVVGTSTRFAGFKRVDRLIRGFVILAEKYDDVILLLVGDGPLRDELESQIASLGLQDRTVFTGYQVDVGAYQALMDVCVFPSQQEPFGLVALEAYQLGKPVIVFSDGGGLLEIVGNLEREDVVKDIDGLAARLEHYRGQDKEQAARSCRRRDYVRSFDMRIVARNFKKIYRLIA